jgi:hypothetical protein
METTILKIGICMKQIKLLLILALGLTSLLVLSACSTTSSTSPVTDADILLTAQAASPLPTEMSGQGLRVVPAEVCKMQEFVPIKTADQQSGFINDPQGDMLAWSPVRDELAYVRPFNGKWDWFVGDMVVYDLELQKEVYTSSNLEVFGDLTWSTDGANLAYVVLNPKENAYTVYVGGLTQSLSTDIFGASAKTDDYSSKKGISGWNSATDVVVTSSCGVDCSTIYNYNTQTQVLSKQNETRKNEDKSLVLVNQTTSPDKKWNVAVDESNNVWLSDVSAGKASIISTGSAVSEIKWSSSSKYLAIRFGDTIKLFDMACKP